MSQNILEPSVNQLASIVDYFKALPARIRQRAAGLARFKSVRNIWWEADGSLAGEVQGGKLYQQEVEFGPKGIRDTFCSCPMEMDCKHIGALLIAFSKGWTITEDEDDEDDEEEVVTQAGTGLKRPAAKARRIAPAKSDSASKPAGPRLAEALALRFGQKLSPADQKRAAQIDGLYKNDTPQASMSFLATLARFSKPYLYYYEPPVTLWPRHRPPADVIEAWIYTTHALQTKKLLAAGDRLFQGVTAAELQRLVVPWQREEAIQRWEQRLSGFIQVPDIPPPVSPAFRLRLDAGGAQMEWQASPTSRWELIKTTPLRQLAKGAWSYYPEREPIYLDEDALRFLRACCPQDTYGSKAYLEKSSPQFITALNRLLRSPAAAASILTAACSPLPTAPEPALWSLDGPHLPDGTHPTPAPDTFSDPASDYLLNLRKPDGTPLENVLALLPGHPNLVITPDCAWKLPGPPHPDNLLIPGTRIPALALESSPGLAVLDRLEIPIPAPIRSRLQTIKAQVTVRCAYQSNGDAQHLFKVQAIAQCGGAFADEFWKSGAWFPQADPAGANAPPRPAPAPAPGTLTRVDRSQQYTTHSWLSRASLSAPPWPDHLGSWMQRALNRTERSAFPDEFLEWISQRPEHITVELDPDLASLRDKGKVTGSFNFDLEETGIDWFDLTLNLQLSDVELSQKEIDLLLKNAGTWVQLPGRGWRKLEFEVSDATQQQLADLGLSAADLNTTEKQRLHVLQLAHPSAAGLLPAERAEQVQRRAADLRTNVSPPLPTGITASLRPYQMEGFHFLAYLSTNRFGGILADDMGLGKTLQALTWLAWLQESLQLEGKPILVVCPKSVQDNWTSEAAKFYPGLPVRQWTSATAGDLENLTVAPLPVKKSRSKKAAPDTAAHNAGPPLLIIINYAQLRLHADALSAITWSTVILDEAQYIKNPTSLTARTVCGLTARHRLALSGTPIENRLLDLWSLMAFAMPGILGNRSSFAKTFCGKDDPFARRRLGSRVRPFLLRRTKKEVAADLPDRIEEDLICTLEGPQQEHYLAELKLARSTLLKAKTSAQLDKLRFNILTSLLRLRQICCHPSLTGKGRPDMESAKLNALLDLLEPLMEEGHKVLIFSQFVEMLHLISKELTELEYPHLLLTGATEDRGSLVRQFQEAEGAHCFLISLKAGGSGLNLTAASYVVLFDPWWNPAVENQAIDRTHRIGQVNKVIAYRLITRETIEEKIRQLQKSKSALAGDILGEETFAKALTLDDFQFLLGS